MTKQLHLTTEERDILHAYEAGELKPIKNMKQTIERYRRYAMADIQRRHAEGTVSPPPSRSLHHHEEDPETKL